MNTSYGNSSYGTNLIEEVDAPFYFLSRSLNYDPGYNNVIAVVQVANTADSCAGLKLRAHI